MNKIVGLLSKPLLQPQHQPSFPSPPLSEPESSTTLGKEQFRALFDFRQRPDCDTVTQPKRKKSKAKPKPSSGLKVDVCEKVTSKASPLRSKSRKRKSDGDLDGSIAKRLLKGYDDFWVRNGIGTSNIPSQ